MAISDSTYSDNLVATKLLSLNLLETMFKLLTTILFMAKSLVFCSDHLTCHVANILLINYMCLH